MIWFVVWPKSLAEDGGEPGEFPGRNVIPTVITRSRVVFLE